MMNIFRITKSSALMARITRSTPSDDFQVVTDDLSAWELVNASLSDDEDRYSFDGDDIRSNTDDSVAVGGVLVFGGDGVNGTGDGVMSDGPEPMTEEDEEEHEDACESRDLVVADAVALLEAALMPPSTPSLRSFQYDGPAYDYSNEYARGSRGSWVPCVSRDNDSEVDEEEDDDDDVYDHDDDLRPWKLKGKFDQKSRMGKVGKKSKPKPYKSHRPQCLGGKRKMGGNRR